MKKLGIVVLTFAVFLLAGCGTNYAKLEKDLTDKASKYYEDNIKDKVLNINNHKIDLAALEASKVDISEFTKEKCDKSSYVLIKLQLDENGKQKGNYQTETHLICGDYETANK
jgi:basic membrane lipoprotein Med (substrate-binding protein (PBP1-ABC) superfamily)